MRLLAGFLVVFLLSFSALAQSATETSARQAIVLEAATSGVLFAKDDQARMPTSSMSKVMTMYLVFEAIERGALRLDQTVKISARAFAQKGSRTFLNEGQEVSIEDLARGVIVQSGNDAAVALAEAVAGSEDSFAVMMNDKAAALGLVGSHFMNATGLPDTEHYSTARDLGLLALALIRDFPNHYHYYSEKEFTFNGIKQGNRNPLLYRDLGADGVKTGHTDDAGYGLIASSVRDGRRIVAVINGTKNMQERADEAAKLLDYGYREYETVSFAQKDAKVSDVPVWLGALDAVPVAAQDDILLTLPRGGKEKLRAEKIMQHEIEAPVKKGQVLGKIVVMGDEMEPVETPLLAQTDIARLNFFKASWAKFKRMIGKK